MAKIVTVTKTGSDLIIDPFEVELQGGVENMVIDNQTGEELEWDVPKGAFTSVGGFGKKVKAQHAEASPTARAQKTRTEFVYKVKNSKKRFRLRPRRLKRRGAPADPVLIID